MAIKLLNFREKVQLFELDDFKKCLKKQDLIWFLIMEIMT